MLSNTPARHRKIYLLRRCGRASPLSMNKDAILATIIGFVIGLCITGLVLLGPRLAKYLPKLSIHLPTLSLSQAKPSPTPSPKQKPFTLTIDSPIAESIESNSDLLVSGTTAGSSTVVIVGNTNDSIAKATSDGKYAGKVTLVEGENDITVTSYNKKDHAAQMVKVYYTPEQF